jgi:HlyD family type I secretion membrane fusion protein
MLDRPHPPHNESPSPQAQLAEIPYPRQARRISRDAYRNFIVISGLSVAGLLFWASTTEIDRVTRGQGRIVPQLQNQIVQHLEGGIVSEILVREGDTVTQGQTLLKIDNSFSRSELAQATIDMKAKQIKMARLTAEVGGAKAIDFPDALEQQIPKIVERERELFIGRQKTLDEQVGILEDQMKQKSLDLSEARSRWTNTLRERELVEQRVGNLRKLAAVGAFSTNELLENERTLQQIEQRLSDLTHEIPRDEAALSEISKRMSEARSRFRSDADKERSETEIQIAKLEETIGALKDRSTRSDRRRHQQAPCRDRRRCCEIRRSACRDRTSECRGRR